MENHIMNSSSNSGFKILTYDACVYVWQYRWWRAEEEEENESIEYEGLAESVRHICEVEETCGKIGLQ
jgi:hypothetical protein